MSINELEENLENERIVFQIFNNDKKVWETVVRIIPEKNLTPSIRLKLLSLYSKITNDNGSDVNKDNFIDQIRNKKNNPRQISTKGVCEW